MNKLALKTEGETNVIVTRRFAASPELVYRAHTDPATNCRSGCSVPMAGPCRCASANPGRTARDPLRMVENGKGAGFYLTGEFLELEPFRRIVHVERMHMPAATPDNHIETRFDPDGTGTLMTMRMTLPDAATRARMLATGMEKGMEASYIRLERLG